MNSITAGEDFPSTKNFVCLNAAKVALMYNGYHRNLYPLYNPFTQSTSSLDRASPSWAAASTCSTFR
jgi:hypothetical protein